MAGIFRVEAVSIPLQDAGRERVVLPRWIYACTQSFEREAAGGVNAKGEAWGGQRHTEPEPNLLTRWK